mgnify:CR=1 FL=1
MLEDKVNNEDSMGQDTGPKEVNKEKENMLDDNPSLNEPEEVAVPRPEQKESIPEPDKKSMESLEKESIPQPEQEEVPAPPVKEVNFSDSNRPPVKKILSILGISIAVLLVVFLGGWAVLSYFGQANQASDVLPAETAVLMEINLDQDSQQAKDFWVMLDKFPLIDVIKERASIDDFSKEIEKSIKEEGLDDFLLPLPKKFTLGLASETDAKEGNFFFVFKREDLDIQEAISSFEEKNEKTIEIKDYEGEKIAVIPVARENIYISKIDDFIVASIDEVTLKNILADYKKQNVFNRVFSKNTNLSQNPNYKKLITKIPQERLFFGYASPRAEENLSQSRLNRLTASIGQLSGFGLASGVNSVDYSILDREDVSAAFVVHMKQGDLGVDLLGLADSEYIFAEDVFLAKEGLIQHIPEKVDGKWVDFYNESKNLYEDILLLKEEESGQEIYDELNSLLSGVDLEKDVLSQLTGNYLTLVAPAFDGTKPVWVFVSEAKDTDKMESKLKSVTLRTESFFGVKTAQFRPIVFGQDKIYSLSNAIFSDNSSNDLFPSNWAIKDDKIIVSNSIEGIRGLIQAFSDGGSDSYLAENTDFKYHFEAMPESISSYYYNYNYGIWGALKYLIISSMSDFAGNNSDSMISILLDSLERVIGPVLKTAKTVGSYTQIEGRLGTLSSTLHVEELPDREKEAANEALKRLQEAISSFTRALYTDPAYDQGYGQSMPMY